MAKRELIWRKTEEKGFRANELSADQELRDRSLCILCQRQLLIARVSDRTRTPK
jgi:hypothetical protein